MFRLHQEIKAKLPLLLIMLSQSLSAQVFSDQEILLLVKKGANHIYNLSDSADYYIASVDDALSVEDHPVVPLMEALSLLWKNIPLITPEVFEVIRLKLESAIAYAEVLDPDLETPEMIYFSMAAYGLLAEYYADQDQYINAVGQARRAYGLLKRGFELADENPEFLFTTGLYNYFREVYPDRHPIYKPLMWFFKRGDAELGLQQLKEACELTVLSRVEAYVYLSYIYLRYEMEPKQAQNYLKQLCDQFPDNNYAKAKYLESITDGEIFYEDPKPYIHSLTQTNNPYFRLAGGVFAGLRYEQEYEDLDDAIVAYKEGLAFGSLIEDHGEYFKSLGNLGLGRIYFKRGELELARDYLNECKKIADTFVIKQKAEFLLSRI